MSTTVLAALDATAISAWAVLLGTTLEREAFHAMAALAMKTA